MLHLESLPLVKRLIGGNGHLDLITDSEEEQTALWLVQGHLADDLVEALREQFFSDWTDATLTGLTFHKLLVKHLSQTGNIDSGGGLMAHILDVVFS